MAYGLQVFDANGNTRLDTTDREFRFVAQYTGSLNGNTTVNITVTGLSTDGTWGLNEQTTVGYYLDVSYSTNTLTIQNTNSSSRPYSVQVFRI